MNYNSRMGKKRTLPKGNEKKLRRAEFLYVLLSAVIYLGAWGILYFLTCIVNLAFSIPPIILLLLFLIYFLISIPVTVRIMNSQGMKAVSSKWLRS